MSRNKYYIKAKVSSEIVFLDDIRHDNLKWWHCNNLLKFVQFLDKTYPNWCWFNVYSAKNKKKQLGNFTKNNRPHFATIGQPH